MEQCKHTNEADGIKIKSSFSSMMIKRFSNGIIYKRRRRGKKECAKRANGRAAVFARKSVSTFNRHKTEWRKMVYERRVNDLYFMPFFFIRTLLSSRICGRSLTFTHSLAASSHSIHSVGRSLPASVLIVCSLFLLPTTSTIFT